MSQGTDRPRRRFRELRIAQQELRNRFETHGDELVRAAPGDALSNLLQRLSRCSDRRAFVVDSGRLVGILSPIDISRKLQVMDLRGRCDVPDVVPGAM